MKTNTEFGKKIYFSEIVIQGGHLTYLINGALNQTQASLCNLDLFSKKKIVNMKIKSENKATPHSKMQRRKQSFGLYNDRFKRHHKQLTKMLEVTAQE